MSHRSPGAAKRTAARDAAASTAARGTAARVAALLRDGRREEAAALTAELLEGRFSLEVAGVEFTLDEYSLNSVSGRVRIAGGGERFFKYHQEEGEEGNVAEYYRARLLATAGLPVEEPLAACTEPGNQIALYELRQEPRLADICLELERAAGRAATLPPALAAARRELDRVSGEVAVARLAAPTPASAQAAIHQLFHHRLTAGGAFPGGRWARFYAADPGFARLARCRWRVNGVEYRHTLGELASAAAVRLEPARLAAEAVTTAHGDDHQGNVWVIGDWRAGPARLRLFDAAFAGDDLPALLAPVKATFHNALAHPFWLYHPAEADRELHVEWSIRGERVELEHDATLSPLRMEVLHSVADLVWRPLLGELAARRLLPDDWRELVRLALFCCPTLVTDVRAVARPQPVQMLGLALAAVAGSEPLAGEDLLADTFAGLAPPRRNATGAAPR